jgi:hypothetical protein
VTIGEVFKYAKSGTISDREFDEKFLSTYPHEAELNSCCDQAIQELADEPYVGRLSCARVMGRAMELLKSAHHLDVPRGWVPVMRKLRATKEQKSRYEKYFGLVVHEAPPVPAEELLSHPVSSIHTIDRDDDQLLALMNERPDVNAVFKTLAKHAVPTSWSEGLNFMNAAIAALGTSVPPAVVIARDKLQEIVDGGPVEAAVSRIDWSGCILK